MSSAWPPPSPDDAQPAIPHAIPALQPSLASQPPPSLASLASPDFQPAVAGESARTMRRPWRMLVAGAVLVASVGAGTRLAWDDARHDAADARGADWPTVTQPLPTGQFLDVAWTAQDDPLLRDARYQLSSVQRSGVVEITTADGQTVRAQIRDEELFVNPQGSDIWIDSANALHADRFLGLSELTATAFGTIDDIVPHRIRPYVTILERSKEELPGRSFVDGSDGVSTTLLRLRLDRRALAIGEPLAGFDGGWFDDDDNLAVWVDETGAVRQQLLDQTDDAATIRLEDVVAELPELDTELDTATYVPLDEFDNMFAGAGGS